jgi:hypothetical protein
MSVLRDLAIGAVGSGIAYFAIKGIERYLALRTIRGRQRKIQQLTAELQLLEKLGVTDRSLLLFAFTILFFLFGISALAVALAMVTALLEPPDKGLRFLLIMFPVIIGLLAFWGGTVFKKLEDPEPNLAKLRQKLLDLEHVNDPDRAKTGGA